MASYYEQAPEKHYRPVVENRVPSAAVYDLRERKGRFDASKYGFAGKLGQGSFGKVALMRDMLSGHSIVVKEIRVDSGTADYEQAANEIRILMNLCHTHVISYIGHEYSKRKMFIYMEYAEKGDLEKIIAHRLRRGGELLDDEQICCWFAQLTMGLRYIHSCSILHRDVKSSNIFVNAANNIKLGDFGISKQLQSTVHARTLIGTPFNISPEIVFQRPYDHRSDVWALGCVLYEMCCGEHPFVAASMDDLMVKIMRGTFTAVTKIRSTPYAVDLGRVVSGLLLESPEARTPLNAVLENWLVVPYITEEGMQLSSQPAKIIRHRPLPSPLAPLPRERSNADGWSKERVPDEMPCLKTPIIKPRDRDHIAVQHRAHRMEHDHRVQVEISSYSPTAHRHQSVVTVNSKPPSSTKSSKPVNTRIGPQQPDLENAAEIRPLLGSEKSSLAVAKLETRAPIVDPPVVAAELPVPATTNTGVAADSNSELDRQQLVGMTIKLLMNTNGVQMVGVPEDASSSQRLRAIRDRIEEKVGKERMEKISKAFDIAARLHLEFNYANAEDIMREIHARMELHYAVQDMLSDQPELITQLRQLVVSKI